VGLTPDEARRRLRHYSLGMRQRLGIAHALLGNPEVLILDEPANGLDPQGIHWMRGLLKGFAEGGGTVLLSSHLLHEVEVVADELILIGRGSIVAQGTKSELLAGSGVVVDALDRVALAQALLAAGFEPVQTSTGAFQVDAELEVVGRTAQAAGLVITELHGADGSGLEELFLQLTASDSREGEAA
jgi:ABC-2 type transport system ATP-binding protein